MTLCVVCGFILIFLSRPVLAKYSKFQCKKKKQMVLKQINLTAVETSDKVNSILEIVYFDSYHLLFEILGL